MHLPKYLHKLESSSALGLMHCTLNTTKIAWSSFVASPILSRVITASTLGKLCHSTRAEMHFVFR